uniref:BED-type domain-containing protein n=1 Tax=Setaria viridis TaxID=4556 RepID=A0A4U6T3S2_SETVI|nr:hypothetical protein SEVIR_9G099433v2 [Setaria viridis]
MSQRLTKRTLMLSISALMSSISADLDMVSSGTKRSRSTTSECWKDFEKIFKNINSKKVRISAKCIHCATVYATRSTIGTGHLERHVEKYPARKSKLRVSQSLLQFNSDGSVHHLDNSSEVAHTQLCRLIARLDLPLCFGASATFEEYIKLTYNPRFSIVSRQTTTRDFSKYFNDCRAKLIGSLTGVSSVSITSDI